MTYLGPYEILFVFFLFLKFCFPIWIFLGSILHLHLCIYQTLLSKATYSTFRLYIFCQYVSILTI